MPILPKDGRRAYLPDIAMTAGSAVSLLYRHGGWSISNRETGLAGDSIGELFGIAVIPAVGNRYDFRGVLRHPPASIWTLGRSFDDASANTRHPKTRAHSPPRCFRATKAPNQSFRTLAGTRIAAARGGLRTVPVALRSHQRPQHPFGTPDSTLFRSDEDRAGGLAARYGLDRPEPERIDAARSSGDRLGVFRRRWLRRAHAGDCHRFGSGFEPPRPQDVQT